MTVAFATTSSVAMVYDNTSLDEPLLPQPKDENEVAIPDPSLGKALTAIAGSAFALLSQYLLATFLWSNTILTEPTGSILWFSLYWSGCTCVLLFAGLVMVLRLTKHRNESNLFEMESYYVVSSLLTISAIWIIADNMVALYVILGMLAMVIAQSKTSLLMTYSLVAGTLGLIFGVCSQFVLSLLFWKDTDMRQPIVENVFVFSMAWSVLTVVLTFMGCYALRWIVENDLRAFLRMEAVYIAASLTGICGAWIFMDMTAGVPEQIVPSILMLLASLAAFAMILWYFPEDKCLEEALQELEEEEAKKESKQNENKVLMVV